MDHTHLIQLPCEEGGVFMPHSLGMRVDSVPHPPDNSLGRRVESMCHTHLIQLPWEEGGVYVPHPPDPTPLGEGWSLCATPT
jgi:hypothetical protein